MTTTTKREMLIPKLHPNIFKEAPKLPVNDGVVILNPKNSLHRAWIEDSEKSN